MLGVEPIESHVEGLVVQRTAEDPSQNVEKTLDHKPYLGIAEELVVVLNL